MSALRWIVCYPTALTASILVWMIASSVPYSLYFGGGVFQSAAGVAPLFLHAVIPTIVFVPLGVLLSPSKGRKVTFVFFALALLCSGGGMGAVTTYQEGILAFWVTSIIGLNFGAILGLLVALRMQAWRSRKAQPVARANTYACHGSC